MRAGDIVVHDCKGHVVALSRGKQDAAHRGRLPKPFDEDYVSGLIFFTECVGLEHPILKGHFAGALVALSVKYYPIDRTGRVRQGYFFPFDMDGLRVILSHSSEALPDWPGMVRESQQCQAGGCS